MRVGGRVEFTADIGDVVAWAQGGGGHLDLDAQAVGGVDEDLAVRLFGRVVVEGGRQVVGATDEAVRSVDLHCHAQRGGQLERS